MNVNRSDVRKGVYGYNYFENGCVNDIISTTRKIKKHTIN